MKFIRVSQELLATSRAGEENAPTFYHNGPWLVRHFFWKRPVTVFELALRNSSSLATCLDFGGGNGVMLPSLSKAFEEVTLLDMQVASAREVARTHSLLNVRFVESDALNFNGEGRQYDTVIAADVLEHIKNAEGAVNKIRELLKSDGVLVTSLPTENALYQLLRFVFRVEKPTDHYWRADEVEAMIVAAGFTRVERRCIPFHIPLLPLFSIAAWRKS